jgi:hypothetical protein
MLISRKFTFIYDQMRVSVTRSKKVGWKSINDDDKHAMEPLNRTYSVISADAALFRTQEERRKYERTNVGNEKEQPLTSQSSSKNDGRSYIHTYTHTYIHIHTKRVVKFKYRSLC